MKQDDIEIFANYCVFMRSIYLHACELFETSSAEDKALMGATAGMFFGDLNQMLKEYIILQVCKITDPAHDVHNNDNHTIAFLLERYDFSSDPSISKRLTDLLASMRAFRDKLRSARNKLISHLDRDTILAGRPLGVATDEDWNQFWLDLQDFVCIVHRKVIGSSFYLNGVAGRSDAGDLLKALKRPVRYPT
jgi:HEPN superfamily AbiU2-like protein